MVVMVGIGFTGQCKELPTAISQGKTLGELEENIKDAIQLVLGNDDGF
jgi:predicted RNase H-like HicB family nuclease